MDDNLATIPFLSVAEVGNLKVYVKEIVSQDFVGGKQYAVLHFEEATKSLPEPTPSEPTPTNTTGGGQGAVTYAGVLKMLNSCKISKYVGSPTTTNCQALCKEGEICVSGIFTDWQYDYHGTGGNVVYSIPVSCEEDVKINPPDMESLYCTCCSP